LSNVIMKIIHKLPTVFLSATLLLAPLAGLAADAAAKPKPDKLTTCPVSGEKLGEMGKPFVFTYKDREVKLCCKNCKKDFDKDPAKYIKLIEAADKAPNAGANKDAKN
jgi:YHS domain-containing protein